MASTGKLPGKSAGARVHMILVEARSSKGNRFRAWKLHLQRRPTNSAYYYSVPRVNDTRTEHRLFFFISLNWPDRPSVPYEAVVNLIASSRASNGHKMNAPLDTASRFSR